jgi:hypothetical protein
VDEEKRNRKKNEKIKPMKIETTICSNGKPVV